jgi:hypothetical protein
MTQKAYRLIVIILIFATNPNYGQNDYEIIDNIAYSTIDDSEFDDRVGLRIESLENGIVTLSETFHGKGIIAKHDSLGKIIWEKSFDLERINDMKVFNGYIYAVGYKYLKRKAWISKIDTNGNVIWEKLLRFQYENEAENLTISESGDIFVLCEIQKAWFPVKIRLKKSMYRHITFRSLKKDIMENEIGIARLDTNGTVKWKKKFGEQKNYNHYFSCAISVNTSELLTSFYFSETNKKQKKEGTRLVKLNYNGKKLNELNHSNRLFEIIVPNKSDFYTIENNFNNKLNIKDTIKISRLTNDSLKISKQYISDYNIYTITAMIKNESNDLYAGGYVCNYKTLGTIWSNHNDIYIAKYDSDFNLLWDYRFDQGSIDKINDMKMINGKLYAIGESWYKENNNQIKKRMRVLILK